MRTRGWNLACVWLLGFTMAAGPASALTIDDFESGDFSLTDTVFSGILFKNQSLPGVLGGIRESFVSLLAPSGSSTIAVGGGAGIASSTAMAGHGFVYDGVANGANSGNGGSLNVDLTGFDRFVIDVVDVTKQDGQVDVAVALWDADSFFTAPNVAASVGALEIPFTSFSGIDFSDIRTIVLTTNGTVGANESLSIGRFVVTPEPGTALLLASGVAGLAWRRARSGAVRTRGSA